MKLSKLLKREAEFHSLVEFEELNLAVDGSGIPVLVTHTLPFYEIMRVMFFGLEDGATKLWTNFVGGTALDPGIDILFNGKAKITALTNNFQFKKWKFDADIELDAGAVKKTSLTGRLSLYKMGRKVQEGFRVKENNRSIEFRISEDLTGRFDELGVILEGYTL